VQAAVDHPGYYQAHHQKEVHEQFGNLPVYIRYILLFHCSQVLASLFFSDTDAENKQHLLIAETSHYHGVSSVLMWEMLKTLHMG